MEAASPSARITYPTDGLIMAFDPDIPEERQRVLLNAAGEVTGLRWRLNGVELADRVFLPRRGKHRLALSDAASREVDEVRNEVR